MSVSISKGDSRQNSSVWNARCFRKHLAKNRVRKISVYVIRHKLCGIFS